MHKIDSSTAVGGEFVSGNPSTGQHATKLNADWFNSVQRELVNLLEKNGVTLSKSNDQQLYDLLKDLIGGNFSKVSVSGQNGAATLENDELKFTSGGQTSSYSKNEFLLLGDNVNISASVTGEAQNISVTGQGGATKIEFTGVTVAGGGNTTKVEADKISSPEISAETFSSSGTSGGTTINSTSVTVAGGGYTTKIESDKIDCSGDVKGWLHSKHVYPAASNQTTVNQNLLDTSVFTAGVIVPIYAMPNTAGSYVNYYGSDGALHSFGVLQHHAVLLVCVGVATVNGSEVPAFCAVVDTNT